MQPRESTIINTEVPWDEFSYKVAESHSNHHKTVTLYHTFGNYTQFSRPCRCRICLPISVFVHRKKRQLQSLMLTWNCIDWFLGRRGERQSKPIATMPQDSQDRLPCLRKRWEFTRPLPLALSQWRIPEQQQYSSSVEGPGHVLCRWPFGKQNGQANSKMDFWSFLPHTWPLPRAWFPPHVSLAPPPKAEGNMTLTPGVQPLSPSFRRACQLLWGIPSSVPWDQHLFSSGYPSFPSWAPKSPTFSPST